MQRNRDIQSSVSTGELPVLPFEMEAAKRAMTELALRQAQLAADLGEAMSQSSETWHDNAPGDAVAMESQVLAESARPMQQIISHGVEFSYPNDDHSEVTLGSIVLVEFPDTKKSLRCFLTGAVRELPNCPGSTAWEQLEQLADIAVTTESPLGSAIFDHKVGEQVSFRTPQGTTTKVLIIDITQFNPLQGPDG
ncbi:MAG: GreA/GreB family elongation factor [Candidatus Saccharibacteria bacterium]|nr:GreA/GreB family elongation factor [Candidatus Saccharibacteria bacterium]